MPLVPKAPPAAAVFDWSGFYAGLHAGYGFGSTYQFDENGRSSDVNWDGFVGGGALGYNWQAGALVLGLEVDISHSDIDVAFNSQPGWGCVVVNGCISKVEWFGTVRGRLGFPAGQLMPYLTAGLAFGEVFAAWGGGCAGACIETVRRGWAAGGGAEWAWSPNWSARIEYLFVDLGSAYNAAADIGTSAKFSTIRGGINYRFAAGKAPAPVVTRY